MTVSVLYDAPGPKARRRVLIGSVIAVALIVAAAGWLYLRLDEQGQFSYERWGPLVDPDHRLFRDAWSFLWIGVKNTLIAAAYAIVLSLIFGTLLAVTRVSASGFWRGPLVALVELLRGVPVVLAIFFAARVLPELGVDLSVRWYLVIGLTLYNSVVIAEIIRAGINALPRGQSEAAMAMGLRPGQSLRIVILPQAFRIMLPALISQLVVVLKDTSLGFIISYADLLRQANIAIQTLRNPIQLYVVVGAMYVAVNYALSRLAIAVERRTSRASRQRPPTAGVGGDMTSGAAGGLMSGVAGGVGAATASSGE
jgi:glutamate transport system permease protein